MLLALNSSGFSILCLIAAILATIYALILLVRDVSALAWMLPASVACIAWALALYG